MRNEGMDLVPEAWKQHDISEVPDKKRAASQNNSEKVAVCLRGNHSFCRPSVHFPRGADGRTELCLHLSAIRSRTVRGRGQRKTDRLLLTLSCCCKGRAGSS
jgi:hypothetical protein